MLADIERFAGKEVGTARTGIRDLAALADGRSEGKTAAPIRSVGNLPATDQKIGGATDIGHVLLAPTDRQFVDRADDENMVAVEIVRTVSDLRIYRKVIVVVVVGVREGIVREELQALRKALLQFDLNAIVMGTGV